MEVTTDTSFCSWCFCYSVRDPQKRSLCDSETSWLSFLLMTTWRFVSCDSSPSPAFVLFFFSTQTIVFSRLLGMKQLFRQEWGQRFLSNKRLVNVSQDKGVRSSHVRCLCTKKTMHFMYFVSGKEFLSLSRKRLWISRVNCCLFEGRLESLEGKCLIWRHDSLEEWRSSRFRQTKCNASSKITLAIFARHQSWVNTEHTKSLDWNVSVDLLQANLIPPSISCHTDCCTRVVSLTYVFNWFMCPHPFHSLFFRDEILGSTLMASLFLETPVSFWHERNAVAWGSCKESVEKIAQHR